MAGQKRYVIDIGGKNYNLLFSFNALCDVERVGGTKELLGDDFETKSLSGARALLWATINASHAHSLTLEQAGDLCDQYIEEHGLKGLLEKVNSLFSDSGWVPKDAAEKNQEPKKKPSVKS